MRALIMASAIVFSGMGVFCDSASAQYYGGGYYRPRVYRPPPPPMSRDAFQAGGTFIGGGLGGMYGGNWGAAAGGAVGGYGGGYTHDTLGARRYYSPPYMGYRTTTPYMIRPGRW
jgi:hypothetical protein